MLPTLAFWYMWFVPCLRNLLNAKVKKVVYIFLEMCEISFFFFHFDLSAIDFYTTDGVDTQFHCFPN